MFALISPLGSHWCQAVQSPRVYLDTCWRSFHLVYTRKVFQDPHFGGSVGKHPCGHLGLQGARFRPSRHVSGAVLFWEERIEKKQGRKVSNELCKNNGSTPWHLITTLYICTSQIHSGSAIGTRKMILTSPCFTVSDAIFMVIVL